MVSVDFSKMIEDLQEIHISAFANKPEVLLRDGNSFKAGDIRASTSNTWIKLDEVVCVLCDLKSSTQLGLDKHYASTAQIYKSSVEGAVRIFREFGADFIDIQGDGGFGLFWGEMAHERALCAAVSIRTFSEDWEEGLPSRWKQSDTFPPTGYKVGIHSDPTLVKKVGTFRVVNEQEAIWAGRAVNYAAKCAQSADRHQVVITQKVWERIAKNDFIAFSCDCEDGPKSTLWEAIDVKRLPEGKNKGYLLKNGWCVNCGQVYCNAILDGETKREIPSHVRHALPREQMKAALEAGRQRAREMRRNRRGTWW